MVVPSERASLADALTDLDHPLRVEARAWAQRTLPPRTARGDAPAAITLETWKHYGDAGILGLIAPSEFGGAERSAIEAMLFFEGLGSAGTDLGVVFALSAQAFVVQRALTLAGSDEQKQRWLGPLISGDLVGCFAVTEYEAGSDSSSLATRAIEQADGSFELTGIKSWVTLGPVSDMAVVFASTNPDLGRWGITAFLIDTRAPGVSCRTATPKIGMNSCPFGDLALDAHRVEADAVLGAVGSGAALFAKVVEAERAFLYASQIGAMERIIDETVLRARTRRQFGAHIGSFQAVSHRIADMKLQHEMARLLLLKAGHAYDQGRPVGLQAALTKLQASDAAARIVVDAMHVFGAHGYTQEVGFGADFGDLSAGLSYAGSADITRNLVSSHLGLDRPLPTT